MTASNGNKISTGIDIGSRTTKIVTFSDGNILDFKIFPTVYNMVDILSKEVKSNDGCGVVATGYGRQLVQPLVRCINVTEIKACAQAASYLDPEAESVIDIGGQDTKAIELKNCGFGRFEMNDRCAAGTGLFLEVMAEKLGYTIEEFGKEAMQANYPIRLNSMCTVFAESEVVSLMAKGEDRRCIALGIHLSVSRRIAAMASRIRTGKKILFVGGVANNPCIVSTLSKEMDINLRVPDNPDYTAALGAALIGMDKMKK